MNGEVRFIFEMIRNKYLTSKFYYYSKLRIASDEFPYILGGFEYKMTIGNKSEISLNFNIDSKFTLNCELEKNLSNNSKIIFGLNGSKMNISPHFNLKFNSVWIRQNFGNIDQSLYFKN